MKKTALTLATLIASTSVYSDSLETLNYSGQATPKPAQHHKKYYPEAPRITKIELPPLPAFEKKITIEKANQNPGIGAPLKVGTNREIEVLSSNKKTASHLVWKTTNYGGEIAAVRIYSPEALALRIAVKTKNLPSSTVFRFSGTETGEVIEVHASEVIKTLNENSKPEKVKEPENTVYWSPPIKGNEITVEIELPSGVSRENFEIAFPEISHLFIDPSEKSNSFLQKSIGESGACNIDFQCSTTDAPSLEQQSRSVARMSFIANGGSYLCTGTLLNNTKEDQTPYLLSANHCISDQATASTLVTYWIYRASQCGSNQLSNESTIVSGGAQLLYSDEAQDTSFMRLNNQPPQNASFSGWSTDSNLYNLNQTVIGLHNPAGDLQKISKGSVIDYINCNTTDCYRTNQLNANGIEVRWGSGVTEGGSSGSGLFNNGRLVAQLYGGFSSCTTPTGRDMYSLLAPAYEAGIKQWLSPPASETSPDTQYVVEFYNPDINHYFMTADVGEQEFVDSGSVGRWIRTGQSFKAGGSTAACRFYGNTNINPSTGAIFGPNSHFYTLDKVGCEQLISMFNPNTPSWSFESYDFLSTHPNKSGECPSETIPVYRLYNDGFSKGKASNHRFITSAALIEPMTKEGWIYEGTHMCAPR